MATERTPLLGGDAQGEWDESHNGANQEACFRPDSTATTQKLRKEIVILSCTSLPASLGYMVQNSIQTVSIAVVAYYSSTDVDLSASAHGFMIAMVTAWTIALGGTTAFDTLASAAVARAQSKSSTRSDAALNDGTKEDEALQQVGILLQRTTLVLLLLFLPCAVLWWFSAPILVNLGQPEMVAKEMQHFLRALVWGAPGYILFEAGKKFCLVQGSGAPTIVLVITAPLNLLFNIACIRWLRLGVIGAATAVSITYYLCAILLAVYVRYRRESLGKAWGGFSSRALDLAGGLQILRLAIPGILMVGSEWVAFEIVALAAGNLDDVSLAAQSVIMTCDQVMNTIPFGLGVAASSRIGNLLGAYSVLDEGNPRLRKQACAQLRIASQGAVLLATVLCASIASLLLLFRQDFGLLFSKEEATIRKVASVLPLVAAFQVFDGWAAANGGILRGMGKQHVGAAANLVAYYIIALPLGIFLAFRYQGGIGLQGLWIGNALALGLVGATEWIIVTFTRWTTEIRRAKARA